MNRMEEKRPAELLREIGLLAAVAFAIGSVIGSGIFKKPGLMASQLGSPMLLMLVWVVAGAMTLFGALSIAEIAGMFHEAGGQYVYFNKCYNDFVGYLYGWAVFIVIQTGSIASIAYVFSDSLGYFFRFPRLGPAWENFAIHIPWLGAITPFKFIGLKLCTIGLLLFLTTLNYLGVRLGSAVQVLFTGLKIAAILAIVLLAFTVRQRAAGQFHPVNDRRRQRFLFGFSGFYRGHGWRLLGLRRLDQRHLPGRRNQESPEKPAAGHGHCRPSLHLHLPPGQPGLHLYHPGP